MVAPPPTKEKLMPVVSKVVNLLDADHNVVTLYPGDEVPDWALERVTNPEVLAVEPPRVDPDPAESQDDSVADAAGASGDGGQADPVEPAGYGALTKDALVALLKERNLDTKGNKPELAARLDDADKAAENEISEPVDVWSLDETELRKLAAERNVDVAGAESTAELATALVQATQLQQEAQ